MRILSVDLDKDYTDALIEAVRVLQRGGIVVYPTDAGYCIGANACDCRAAEQVFKIKKRPLSKPLPILARNIKWARELAIIPPKLEAVLFEIWPGVTTVILPRKKIIPLVVTAGDSKVGIRVSSYTLADKLLGRFGYPLIATSARIDSGEDAGDINKIIESLKENIWRPDLVINVGFLFCSTLATLDLSMIKPRIIKTGPSKPEELMKLLKL